ncbi:MAG TPA: hypothetical protein VI318_11670 [Baekduia sp.]
MLRTRRSRMFAIAGGCALAILIRALARASPAGAADPAVCAGTEQASYSPGVTLTPREVNAHVDDAFTCVSSDPGAASGNASDSYTWHGSRLDLPVAVGG